MGFPIEDDSEKWVTYRVGATLLTLRPRGLGPGGWDDGPSVSGSAAVQLAFRVPPPAVDACHAELVAKGVTILREPTDIPRVRHRTLFVRDPEGNVIEIYAEY
jgi:glyoxylase I family protein